jgi:hypothetical protein
MLTKLARRIQMHPSQVERGIDPGDCSIYPHGRALWRVTHRGVARVSDCEYAKRALDARRDELRPVEADVL